MKQEVLKRLWNYLNNYKELRYDDEQNLQCDIDKKYLEDNFPNDKDVIEAINFVPDEWEDLDTRRSKIRHIIPMTWLRKVFSKESIFEFIEKIKESEWENIFNLWLKYDWTACAVRYNSSFELDKAITRWNWFEWDDITENAKMVHWIPLKLNSYFKSFFKEEDFDFIEVRWEVLCDKEVFERLWKKFNIKNTRQYSSWSLKRKDPKDVKDRELTFIPYTIILIKDWKSFNMKWMTQYWIEEMLLAWEFIGHSDFNYVNYCIDTTKENWKENLWRMLESLYAWRNDFIIDIDWLVVKADSFETQNKYHNSWEAYAIAYKFPNENHIVEIESIDYQVWKTWRITPVVNYTPVDILWVTCSRATWHNSENMKKMQIKIWDKISIIRSWDVIPYIVEVLESSDWVFTQPEECPICNTKLIDDWTFQICNNKTCQAKIDWTIRTVIQNAWINFLWWTKIDEMIEQWILSWPYDIFKVNEEKLFKLERTWQRTVDKIMNSIENARDNLRLETIISWFNILWLGYTNWEKITEAYCEIENWSQILNIEVFKELFNSKSKTRKKFFELLEEKEWVWPVLLNRLDEFFVEWNEYLWMIEELLSDYVWNIFIDSEEEESIEWKLTWKSFYLTWKLSISRWKFWEAFIIPNWWTEVRKIKDAEYLLIWEKPTQRKVEEAESLWIKIINEKEFHSLLN